MFLLQVRLDTEYHAKLLNLLKHFNIEADNQSEQFRKLLDSMCEEIITRVEVIPEPELIKDARLISLPSCYFASLIYEQGKPFVWCDNPRMRNVRKTNKVYIETCQQCWIRMIAQWRAREKQLGSTQSDFFLTGGT